MFIDNKIIINYIYRHSHLLHCLRVEFSKHSRVRKLFFSSLLIKRCCCYFSKSKANISINDARYFYQFECCAAYTLYEHAIFAAHRLLHNKQRITVTKIAVQADARMLYRMNLINLQQEHGNT